jgi:UDP-GlcNAc:undecaprenyl-phosphate/decaprenyl-phosphate GlcNAc-1-phosphate transferase
MTATVVISAAALSAIAVWAVVGPLTSHGVVDVPAPRSLHVAATPRGGGIGLLVAVLVVVPASAMLGQLALDGADRWLLGALLAIGGLGILGLFDDLRSLGVRSRFLTQSAVAAGWAVAAVMVTGSAWPWVAVLVLAVIGLVNVTNFMDGANGLISLHGVVASTWYILVGMHEDQEGVVLLAAAALGGAIGFLPFNAPVARIFLGDVGSYTFGAVWAVLSSWLLINGTSIVVVAAPLVVLVVDALVTMVRRAIRGERATDPHRLHVYQRLVAAGWSHTKVTVVVSTVALWSCLCAIPVLIRPTRALEVMCLAGVLVVSTLYLTLTTLVDERGRWPARNPQARR